MATKTDIANLALQKLGAKRITSIEENTPTAKACNAIYESCKKSELEKHSWIFAIRRASVSADATAPTWGRSNAFTLPADCLKVLGPYPEDDTQERDWEIEGRKILTDEDAPLRFRYIYNVTDPNEMSELFIQALATRMAIELCEPITQSNTKKEILKDDYKDVILEARNANAIQRVAGITPDDPWFTVRL